MTQITHVDQLLSYHGQEFVDHAYRSILGRSADRDGRTHYLKRLSKGDGKEAVLLAIASSAEARTMRVTIDGFPALANHIPKWWTRFIPGQSSRNLERLMNQLKHSMGEQQNSIIAHLSSLERDFQELRLAVGSLSAEAIKSAPSAVARAPIARSVKSKFVVDPSGDSLALMANIKKAVQSSAEANAFV